MIDYVFIRLSYQIVGSKFVLNKHNIPSLIAAQVYTCLPFYIHFTINFKRAYQNTITRTKLDLKIIIVIASQTSD